MQTLIVLKQGTRENRTASFTNEVDWELLQFMAVGCYSKYCQYNSVEAKHKELEPV